MSAGPRSETLLARASARIPGGVNSPVRSFSGVGGHPLFFRRGAGACLYDADGRRFIDYVCSWGAVILGHAHPDVIKAVRQSSENGLGFGTPVEVEVEFAEELCAALEGMDKVRVVNSGTEATMSAIRLARGFTGRDLIVKFAGCYHGHADSLLVAAGSGVLTLGIPSSAGVPAAAIADTFVLPYNDGEAVGDCFRKHGDRIAAVIVEPVAGNMNLVRGSEDFLRTLQSCCNRHGAVLIFDEVMSGFRVGKKGAQGLLGVTPDLTCLGKVIGGGLGVAAFGGRRDIMDSLAPLGKVYQAGTLSGNPVALSAGLATLRLILNDEFYRRLNAVGDSLCQGLIAAADGAVPFSAQSVGGMFGFYFRPTPPANFGGVETGDIGLFRAFFHAMLKRGVYLAPSAFEAGFIGSGHEPPLIEETLAAAKEAFQEIASPSE